MDAETILGRYRAALGPGRPAAYVSIAARWFRLARRAMADGYQPTEADVRGYVQARRRAGAADSTILHELAAVRRMYATVGCALPVPDLHLRPPAETGPTLAPESILALIGWARRPDVSPLLRGYVAVATVYAARASEIGAVRIEDVDLQAGRIYLWTVKDGVRRWQGVPQGVGWALKAPWRPRRPGSVAAAFHVACAGAGIIRRPRMGWHSVRRGLNHALRDAGVSAGARRDFSRWSPGRPGPGGRQGIEEWYAGASTLLTPTGAVRVAREDPDAEAWARHPFVAAWGR